MYARNVQVRDTVKYLGDILDTNLQISHGNGNHASYMGVLEGCGWLVKDGALDVH